MKDTPIDPQVVRRRREESGLPDLGGASIRELVRLVNLIEKDSGQRFVRMEMGVPGLAPPEVGTLAEIQALRSGVASKYPMIEGIEPLKNEISRFVKLFLNQDVDPRGCLPTVGSMQGALVAFLVANRTRADRRGTLFIDPGFPVQKQQLKLLGQDFDSFDVYDYRGLKLRDKLESMIVEGKISSLLYSNPNNPAWICFTENELQTIGELANKYDVVVIEDLAYFGMDFRNDYSKPGQPPYQPTVANYTDNYIFLISSSKAFSYAGQRVGSLVVSDKLFERRFPDLKRYYKTDGFGYSVIYGALYPLSAGVTHSAQFGMAAMLKAANDGEFNFVDTVRIYGDRAKRMKDLFTANGFNIVYDHDEELPLADGFYFTFSYPGMTGSQLLESLIYYGISAISLAITGSSRLEGLRACVSQVSDDQIDDLAFRLERFRADHKF